MTEEVCSIRILFVCSANHCRSPLAEAIFRDITEKAGVGNRFEVDSAGASSWQLAKQPHAKVVELLKQNGIECAHEARLIHVRDLAAFDYVLAMDNDVLRSIFSLGKSQAKVQPFIKYAPHAGYESVPDPMHESTFEEVYSLIAMGCYNLLVSICRAKSIELPERPF